MHYRSAVLVVIVVSLTLGAPLQAQTTFVSPLGLPLGLPPQRLSARPLRAKKINVGRKSANVSPASDWR